MFKIEDIRNYTGNPLVFVDPVSGCFVTIPPLPALDYSVEIIESSHRIVGVPVLTRIPYLKTPMLPRDFSAVIITSTQYFGLFKNWPFVFYCTERNFTTHHETKVRYVSSLTAVDAATLKLMQ
mgnify:CR=1 FL=1